MTTLQTKDSDGSLVVFGNPKCPPVPKPGYTIRKVDGIPPRPATGGTLRWDDATGGLTWAVPPSSPIEQARAAAAAVFAALPLGKQALWEPVRAAVDADLKAGKVADAAERIRTVPKIYTGMEKDQAAFLKLFPAA